jgi:hypothetical protein
VAGGDRQFGGRGETVGDGGEGGPAALDDGGGDGGPPVARRAAARSTAAGRGGLVGGSHRRWGRFGRSSIAAAMTVGALAGLAACGDDEAPVATGGELIRLDAPPTTPAPTPPPTAVPSSEAVAATEPTAPVDPVEGCLDWYQFKIEAADAGVVEIWEDELDEDLVQLVAECERLAAEEPQRVEDMIAENEAIDEFLSQMAAQTTVPGTTIPDG